MAEWLYNLASVDVCPFSDGQQVLQQQADGNYSSSA
jgi:hypothetical protein